MLTRSDLLLLINRSDALKRHMAPPPRSRGPRLGGERQRPEEVRDDHVRSSLFLLRAQAKVYWALLIATDSEVDEVHHSKQLVAADRKAEEIHARLAKLDVDPLDVENYLDAQHTIWRHYIVRGRQVTPGQMESIREWWPHGNETVHDRAAIGAVAEFVGTPRTSEEGAVSLLWSARQAVTDSRIIQRLPSNTRTALLTTRSAGTAPNLGIS